MKLDTERGVFSVSGREYPIDHFRNWFKVNYQPVIHVYYIGGDKYDWESVFKDVMKNGIIEIYINEYAEE